MSVGSTYQRGDIWYYAWSYRGRRHKRSSHSTSETVAKKLLAEAIQDAKDTASPDERRMKFEHLVQRVLNDRKVKGRDKGDTSVRVLHLKPFFGGRRVIDITTALVVDYVASRLDDGAAPASINRETALLRRGLRLLEVRRMPTFCMLREDNVRQDFLDWGEFLEVRERLPEWLKDFVTVACLSTWRQSQLAALEWRDVDMRRREITARGETTKNGRPHRIPLTGELWEIFERAHAARRLDCPYVFHRNGARIQLRGGTSLARRAWKKACEEAGFPDHWIHCLRRSGIRNMIQVGEMDPMTAMEWSGHKDPSMLRRYNIITTEGMRRAMERTMERLAQQPASKVRAIGGNKP